MKKSGFTLIELLAVIIILAIIALIAMPLVLNTIEKAKQGAAVASAYAYAEEVDRYLVLSQIDSTLPQLQTGVEYKLSQESNEVAALADPATTFINDLVSIKGDKPTSGYLKLDGEYKIEKMEMVIKSYPVTCEKDECKITGSKIENEEEEEVEITEPVITLKTIVPKLTEYGFEVGTDDVDKVLINYPKDSKQKLYKIGEDGEWVNYTEPVLLTYGQVIYAKGIDKNNKETNIIQYTSQNNSLGSAAYDDDVNSYYTLATSSTELTKYFDVKSNMVNQVFSISYVISDGNYLLMLQYLDASNNIISSETIQDNRVSSCYGGCKGISGTKTYTIPKNTVRIALVSSVANNNSGYVRIKDITVSTLPTIDLKPTSIYPTLTEHEVIEGTDLGHNDVSINYYQTAVQKLYRVGEAGEWLNYTGTISVDYGQTIYAKSIDKNGLETPTATFTSIAENILQSTAWDGLDNTYSSCIDHKLKVSKNLWGEEITMKLNAPQYSRITTSFLAEDLKTVISSFDIANQTITVTKEIPENTHYIYFKYVDGDGPKGNLYEIKVIDTPTFEQTSVYPVITNEGITPGYNNVIINYYQTAVQKLYRIGEDGEWLEYKKPIAVDEDVTIYAKSIDKNGKESTTATYKTTVGDMIGKNGYDTNDSSYTACTKHKIKVDKTVWGKNVSMKIKAPQYSNIKVSFLAEDLTTVNSSFNVANQTITVKKTIPENTYYINFEYVDGNGVKGSLYTIKLVD